MHVRKPFAATAAAVLLTVGVGSAGSATVTVVRSRYPSPDVILAAAVLRPPVRGTDASPVIQAAVDRVARKGGGTVFLFEGYYRLDAPLTLKEGVTLRGETPAVPVGTGPWTAFTGKGTVLAPVRGRGSPEGPAAIVMERGTGLTHLAVWYPDQRADAIEPYPWTIAGSTSVFGDNYTVRDVLLVNPYQAMRFGPEWNELHTIQNVRGTPLKTGIFIDTCTDIGRLTNVEFSPTHWESAKVAGAPTSRASRAALRGALRRDATGVEIGRSDWEYLFRVRVKGYATGFRYRPGAQGATNGVMFGCEAVACDVGIDVVEMNGIGLAASMCRFEGRRAGVLTRPTYTAVVQLNDCDVRAHAGSALDLKGPGTVTAVRTRLAGAPSAVDARAGRIVAIACQFGGRTPHARFAAEVGVVRVLGCRARGSAGKPTALVTQGNGAGDTVIDHRPVPMSRPRDLPPMVSTLPRPPSGAVLDASAHGVTPDASDVTRHLQAVLERAGRTGGTVFVPAGRYRVAGALKVPANVELRGSFDVPHHTQSGGTVLLATGGRGQERGIPLIRLQPGSGVRGLTVWYPEQSLDDPVPYPWTVRSLGPRCWVTDLTIGNGWQGVDFWTNPSTGHTVRYLAGGFFRRGLFVSKSTSGTVEDVQMNPHYMARLQADLPRPQYTADPFGKVIDFQQAKLEGLVFGRCRSEQVLRTFLYAAVDGLAFYDDRGGASGVVVNHGTDAASRAVTFGATAREGIDLLNTQLVVLGRSQVGAVVSTRAFKGAARLYCSQVWAPGTLALLQGPGRVELQQFNNATGPARAEAGSSLFLAGIFQGGWSPAVKLSARATGSAVVGCLQPRGMVIEDASGRALVRANSPAPRIPAGPSELASGFEPGQPAADTDAPQDHLGGNRSVSGLTCRPAPGAGRDGGTAVRMSGHADNPDHSWAYARLFATRVVVHPDTVLTYWIKPSNALSLKSGIDLVFADNTTLRDSGASDTDGRGAHPGTDRGAVGEWRRITVPLGHKAGEVVTVVMAAFDGRPGGGPFETLFDDIRIGRGGARR